LSIAGSDCSAGAGIQADLKTFQFFGVHGLTAVTCVVSETANEVRSVHAVPADLAANQASLLLGAFPVRAAKTGMLFSAEIIRQVAAVLQNHADLALVVDPVMIASTGDALLEPDAITAYREVLFPLASVITPNLHEAEALLGARISHDTLEAAAMELERQLGAPVLLKGGHLPGASCIDLLCQQQQCFPFSSPRLNVQASHGTGCTLSSAITARLALGDPLPAAVAAAKHYLGETLRHGYTFVHPTSGETIHALNQGTRLPGN
jgi:hydroxymethylpyrimidine/phosphomethylpyrimidine kinase